MPSARHVTVPLPLQQAPEWFRFVLSPLVLALVLMFGSSARIQANVQANVKPDRAGVAQGQVDSIRWINPQKNIQLGMLAVLAAEMVLLFLLLTQVKRTNRAGQVAARQTAMGRVVADFSERFGRCPADEVETEIHRGLEAIRAANQVDRAMWFVFAEDPGEPKQPFASAPEGIEEIEFRFAKLPWIMDQVCQGRNLAVENLGTLPQEADSDREYLESNGIRCIAFAAASSEAAFRSALLLIGSEPRKEWSADLLNRLGVMEGLFANALRRKRTQRELQEKREWLQMALEASMIALWELDVQTGQVRWSQKQDSLLGRGPVELEVSYQKFLELVPEEDREDLFNRAVALLRDPEANEIATEWRFHQPAGGVRWLLFRGKVFRDGKGKPLRLRGVNLDITELKQAKMELLQLTERLIKAQEQERQRLARDLHDDIGQRLSLLVIELDRLKQELPAELVSQQASVAAALKEATGLASDIHALSHQLHSAKLEHLGLRSAMKELCTQVSKQHGIEVTLVADGFPGNIPEERVLCLYRVAQEALQNAAKHSGARRVAVELIAHNSALQMRVRDDGCGFDVSHCEAGLGLASMKERLRIAGGTLEVQSALGRGTEILAQVPVEKVSAHASVS